MIRVILLLFTLIQFACSSQEQPVTSSATFLELAFTSGIRSIFEDSKGNYWFGSMQEGVCRYDGKSLRYFTAADGLSNNQVLSIREDQSGIIWFGTQHGLSSYDGSKMTDHSQHINMDVQYEWESKHGDLWFNAGINEGVYRYDRDQIEYLAFPAPKVINTYNIYSLTCFSKGGNRMLWFGTYAGVFGYDGNDFTIINDETLGLDVDTEPLHIRSILEDSKGRLWIGNNGIGVLLKDGDEIRNFSEEQNLIHPTSSRRGDMSPPGTLEHVFTIAEDSHGNIWFGDRDAGIWKYDGREMTSYSKENGLSSDFAVSIYEDSSGSLWFGMADGSLYKYDETFVKQF
jgi:ligand-binding sensor domain-containing protein